VLSSCDLEFVWCRRLFGGFVHSNPHFHNPRLYSSTRTQTNAARSASSIPSLSLCESPQLVFPPLPLLSFPKSPLSLRQPKPGTFSVNPPSRYVSSQHFALPCIPARSIRPRTCLYRPLYLIRQASQQTLVAPSTIHYKHTHHTRCQANLWRHRSIYRI